MKGWRLEGPISRAGGERVEGSSRDEDDSWG